MKNDKIVYGLLGLVIGAAGMRVLTSTILPSNNQMMGNQSRMQNSETIDAHFIEQMIPHHEDAITMAKLAQTRATRSEVKELADNIINSQGKEITQMKSWYKDWFGRELPTGDAVMNQHGMMGNTSGMHMGMMGNESDLASLESSEDFDRTFVEHMIPHHQMAVMMASMLKNGTNRAEMKQLAEEIISAQTQEIDQMRTWLNEWK